MLRFSVTQTKSWYIMISLHICRHAIWACSSQIVKLNKNYWNIKAISANLDFNPKTWPGNLKSYLCMIFSTLPFENKPQTAVAKSVIFQICWCLECILKSIWHRGAKSISGAERKHRRYLLMFAVTDSNIWSAHSTRAFIYQTPELWNVTDMEGESLVAFNGPL